MKAEHLVIGPPPPREAKLKLKVRRPGPGEKVQFLVASVTAFGVYTHWLHGRTQPCLDGPERCEGCASKCQRRWKGYLAGVEISKRLWTIIEFTPEAAYSAPELTDPTKNLRGARLTLHRQGQSVAGKVLASVELAYSSLMSEPPFDLLEQLKKVWWTKQQRSFYTAYIDGRNDHPVWAELPEQEGAQQDGQSS